MSPVVVHDFVVQVLLVGQVPVGCQVLLVRLLMEVTQLGCRGHGESVGQAARGRCRGPMATQPNPVPGEGAPSPAITLQQVGHEQRRALVAAGQPPLCQVLLDLEGEEVPVEGTGACPGREPGSALV